MRSSSGEYYVGLDHVRALAVFMVFTWHFLHVNNGHLEPHQGTFDFIGFSLFAEGHTGVSLFMVLSGYLFAKLTHNKNIDYRKFLAARAVRLLPLLLAVCLYYVLSDFIRFGPEQGARAIVAMLKGVIFPTLPNGIWSITVEFHFYLIFPLIILLERRLAFSSIAIIATAFLIRVGVLIFDENSTAQGVAYWTIFGRIDQFIIGILFARYGQGLAGRHLIAVVTLVAFLAGYAWFDSLGGYHANTTFPNIWLFNLALEALAYGALIAYYDLTYKFAKTGVSGCIARVGEASYSIYLLHFFWVFQMTEVVNQYVVVIDTIYKGLFFSFLCFIPTAMIGWQSYRRYECYWLRFRRPYAKDAKDAEASTAKAAGAPGVALS